MHHCLTTPNHSIRQHACGIPYDCTKITRKLLQKSLQNTFGLWIKQDCKATCDRPLDMRLHAEIRVNITRCSAIAERPRCRVRYRFRYKWKTVTGRHVHGDTCTDTIGLSSTTEICRIQRKTQNKGYYGVLGHSRSSSSVPMESPYASK